MLYHSSPSALLPLLPRYLKLITANIIDSRLCTILFVVLPYTVAKSYTALQLVQQHAIAMLYDRLAVSILLQIRANLRHDVRVHRL